jgi:hypothetical protein
VELIQRYLLRYDPERDIQDGERYELDLLLIHIGNRESRIFAEEFALRLKEASKEIKDMDLIHCEARSAAEVTLADFDVYETLRLDHISHEYDRPDDIQEI